MRVLLDTNAALDVLMSRSPWFVDAEAVWEPNRQGRLEAFIAASQLTDIFYLVNRVKGATAARLAVVDCLKVLTLTVDQETMGEALRIPLTDFEDAVLVAVATQNGIGMVVTRDQKGFVGASIAAVDPAGLIARLPSPAEDEN